MEGNWSKVNRTSAATVPSYKAPQSRAKYGSEKLALIIPTLREAANVEPLLRRVRFVLEPAEIDWEVIVVDDNSGDGTEEILGALARQDPRVRLLVRRGERGLSGAILHGWRETDATILGVMDADGQHPAELLPALIEAVGNGCDLGIASRYAKGGRCGSNPVRRLASMAAVIAARLLQRTGSCVRDPLSGFFLVRRQAVENVCFQTAGFKLLLEILVRGRVIRAREIPFAFGRRRAGRSKLSARVVWEYLVLLARLYAEKYRSVRAQEVSGD